MSVQPSGPFEHVPPPPPSRPQTVEASYVAQQLTGKALIERKMAEFEQTLAEFKALIPTITPRITKTTGVQVEESQYQPSPPLNAKAASKEESPYHLMPPPKAKAASKEESLYHLMPPPKSELRGLKPSPPTSPSPRRPQFVEARPEEALLQKKFIAKQKTAKPSAWGAAFRLLGRAAAIASSPVLIPYSYLCLTISTVLDKAAHRVQGTEGRGRSKEHPKGTQYEKMKARFYESTFRSDLDVMYHGIRAVGDPRDDVKVISAALLSIVKK